MAVVLLRQRLAERHVTARVDSAGFLGAGWPAVDEAVLAAPLTDDIADPMGGPRSGYDRTGELLDELLTRLAGLIRPT